MQCLAESQGFAAPYLRSARMAGAAVPHGGQNADARAPDHLSSRPSGSQSTGARVTINGSVRRQLPKLIAVGVAVVSVMPAGAALGAKSRPKHALHCSRVTQHHNSHTRLCRAASRCHRRGFKRSLQAASCSIRRLQRTPALHQVSIVSQATAPSWPAGYQIGLYAKLRGRTGSDLTSTVGRLVTAGVQFTREDFSWSVLE